MGECNIYFLIQPKYNSMQIQQLQHWYSTCNSKEIFVAALNGRALNVNATAVNFFLLSAFICLPSSFLFQHRKKNYEYIYHSPTVADWDSMGRVVTQTLGRVLKTLGQAFDFLLRLQTLGQVFGKLGLEFENNHWTECFVKESL